MVCKPSLVRMATMVRLLSSGNHMEITAEEAAHEKITVQTINREFREANEANLLEEEDMHVFDSLPLKDPLHLVSCNACKKPIKASQYASHAERCRLSNSSQDIIVELDGDAGNKKPPRKGRKKLETGLHNQVTPSGEQEKSESVNEDDAGASDLNLDDHSKMISCIHGEGKHAPAPLATKLYYTQGSHRLRAAIAHLYRESVAKDASGNLAPKLVQDKIMILSQVPSVKSLHGKQKDNAGHHKNDLHAGYAARHPDQILAQTSESCLGASGGYSSTFTSANQFHESNFLRNGLLADNAAVGTMRTRYHASSHALPGNPGASLGTMQQQNGTVPVG